MDFTEARHSEWQWHQLGHMQVYTSLQTENHASTPPWMPFLLPANSVKAMNTKLEKIPNTYYTQITITYEFF